MQQGLSVFAQIPIVAQQDSPMASTLLSPARSSIHATNTDTHAAALILPKVHQTSYENGAEKIVFKWSNSGIGFGMLAFILSCDIWLGLRLFSLQTLDQPLPGVNLAVGDRRNF